MQINRNPFYPIQPEMISHSQFYLEYKPKQLLANEVALFYQFQTSELAPDHLPVIPDGCIDLLFCCDPVHPMAILATRPEHRCLYPFKQNCVYFGVRFLPEQTLLKLPCSIKELIQQQQTPLFDVLSEDTSLLEQIILLPCFSDRIRWFISYFQQKQQETSYDQNLIKFCINGIYATRGIIPVQQLAEESGYSCRYLQKKFEDYIGFSPKQFCQIVRLQHAVHELLHHHQQLSTVVDDGRFYDKAHFYKGFKKYMNCTPKQYLSAYQTSTFHMISGG